MDVEAWVASLQAVPAGDGAALAAAMAKVDLRYDPAWPHQLDQQNGHTTGDTLPVGGVELFLGQMDSDATVELVVQLRLHDERYAGAGSRDEAFWIGVFDQVEDRWVLAGRSTAVVHHCNWDDNPLGLLLGFTSPEPGDDAALWVTVQQTGACGTFIDYYFDKTEYRIVSWGLEARPVSAPAGMSYDRLDPPG